MILSFRIALRAFADGTPGEGARLYGGRWNPPGVPVLYTSDSVALAALEVMANMSPNFPEPDDDFCRVTYGIPAGTAIRTVDPNTLPTNWQSHPAPLHLAELGRLWSEDKEHLVLKVPSAIVGDSGWNYLFNPRHPDFSTIQMLKKEPFTFDYRLIR